MQGICRIRRIVAAVLFVTTVVAWQSVALACPTCKDGLAQDQTNMVQGYFWSILFMMSMPFLIFSSLCLYFYWLVRRARAQQAAAVKAAIADVARSNDVVEAPASETTEELVEV